MNVYDVSVRFTVKASNKDDIQVAFDLWIAEFAPEVDAVLEAIDIAPAADNEPKGDA